MHRIEWSKKVGALFAGLGLAATTVACDMRDIGSYCEVPGQCSSADATGGAGGRRDATPPDSVIADGPSSRNPLCGMVGCFPGYVSACGAAPLPDAAPRLAFLADAADDVSDDAATDDATTSGDGATGSDATDDACHEGGHDGSDGTGVDATDDAASDAGDDATVDAGADAEPEDAPREDASTPDGGADDASSTADARLDVGSTDEPRIAQSCYIRPATVGVTTECAPVGSGAAGSACTDSQQCRALMACVEAGGKATCQFVSCALPSTCISGMFYQELPLRVATGTRRDILIPVCLPTENCTLLSEQSCPSGKTCAVVGNDGETACVVPGTAMVGEACSETQRCAGGLLCSKFSDQCVKICHVAMSDVDCPTGMCQGGSLSLPDGFGICVGQAPDGG